MKVSKKNILLLILGLVFIMSKGNAQEKIYQTFKDRKIINLQSTETLDKYKFDFRVSHRFGDMFGDRGGWSTFYGFENAADISIGFDYGLTDKFMVGIMRTKGAGPLQKNLNSYFKYKLLTQESGGNNSISLAFFGMASYSTMQKSTSIGDINYFEKAAHRLSYHLQIMMARKFSDRFSLQIGGAWTYRNLVSSFDKNDLPSVSAGTRIQITKVLGLILEGTYAISSYRANNDFFPILGIGLEWETGGGHVFQINLTNARGLAETDYIPYTQSDFTKGEFRLGFTISRVFKI